MRPATLMQCSSCLMIGATFQQESSQIRYTAVTAASSLRSVPTWPWRKTDRRARAANAPWSCSLASRSRFSPGRAGTVRPGTGLRQPDSSTGWCGSTHRSRRAICWRRFTPSRTGSGESAGKERGADDRSGPDRLRRVVPRARPHRRRTRPPASKARPARLRAFASPRRRRRLEAPRERPDAFRAHRPPGPADNAAPRCADTRHSVPMLLILLDDRPLLSYICRDGVYRRAGQPWHGLP